MCQCESLCQGPVLTVNAVMDACVLVLDWVPMQSISGEEKKNVSRSYHYYYYYLLLFVGGYFVDLN